MISQLCKEIEHALKRHIATPKDFEFLRSRIFARHHIYLSTTTLMRIWGYVNENVEPRRSTLNILSQFLGYSSWEDFQYNASLPQELQSSPVLNRRLSVEKSLRHGDRLRLIWLPDRVCDIEYLGNRSFRVVASENTRLHEGDTFDCSLIIDGEPMYMDNLIQGDCPPIAYVCGKISGVRYEFIE